MPTARSYHKCGLVTNVETGDLEIVAAGGYSNDLGIHLNRVEIFSMGTKTWRKSGRVSVSQN
jgi:hypothetical protein